MKAVDETLTKWQCELEIPPEQIGRLLGRGGETISAIREETNTRITVTNDDSGRVYIEAADEEAVEAAIAEVEDILSDGEIVSMDQVDAVVGWIDVNTGEPPK